MRGIALGIVKLNLTARTAESPADVREREVATQLQQGVPTHSFPSGGRSAR